MEWGWAMEKVVKKMCRRRSNMRNSLKASKIMRVIRSKKSKRRKTKMIKIKIKKRKRTMTSRCKMISQGILRTNLIIMRRKRIRKMRSQMRMTPWTRSMICSITNSGMRT